MGPPGDGDTVILTFFRGDMVIFAEKCKRCGDIGKMRWYIDITRKNWWYRDIAMIMVMVWWYTLSDKISSDKTDEFWGSVTNILSAKKFCPTKILSDEKICPTNFFFWYSKDTWTAFVKDQGAWVSSLFVAFFLVHFQEWNQSILPRDYRVFKRAVQRASNFPHLHPFTYDKIRCHRSYEQFLLRSDVLRIFFLASIYPLPQPSRYPQWRGSLRGSLRNML